MSQISFNCTLIAHENVTTEFFGRVGSFCFILFYSLVLILCELCLVVFIASKNLGPGENALPFVRVFTSCLASDTNTPVPANISVPVRPTAKPRQEFRLNTLK